jgi:RNA polymerase sigma factor (sigma-70 family)
MEPEVFVDLMKPLRTAAYRQFGVFRAIDSLKDLRVTIPSEQLAGIALFLRYGLGGQQDPRPLLGAPQEVVASLSALLKETIDRHKDQIPQYLRPLKDLAVEVEPLVAWDPFREFAELLSFSCSAVYSQVAGRLATRFTVSVLDMADLAAQFTMAALPSALCRFDPARGRERESAWLETVYHRYACKALVADAAHRRQLQTLAETHRPPELGEAYEGEAQESLLTELPNLVQRLPERERVAVELYYGFRDREFTISELAAELRCSEYYARAALLHGLMQLAAELGVQGALDDSEFRFLQLYFEEGRDLSNASRSLGWELPQARAVLQRVQQVFVRGLRRRTRRGARPSSPEPPARPSPAGSELPIREDNIMPTHQVTKSTAAGLSKELSALRQDPEMRIGTNGRWLVHLGGQWMAVSEVRSLLRANEALVKTLQGMGTPLGWLAVPDLDLERRDTWPGAVELESALAEMERRAFVAAQTLANDLLAVSAEKGIDLPTKVPDDLAEHVLRALGGTVIAIETELPRALRRRGEAVFRIHQTGSTVRAEWEGGQTAPVDLIEIITHQASLLGEFGQSAAAELTRLILQALFAGESVLPQMPVRDATDTTASLSWQKPSVRPS